MGGKEKKPPRKMKFGHDGINSYSVLTHDVSTLKYARYCVEYRLIQIHRYLRTYIVKSVSKYQLKGRSVHAGPLLESKTSRTSRS